MRTPRLYLDQPLRAGAELDLGAAAARHARSVLRLRPGAAVVVFDGRGHAHQAELVALARERATVRLGAALGGDPEPPLEVILALGISRGERMDLAVQKAVELGVGATEHGVVRLDDARAARRVVHWQGVASSACEQCGRNRVPGIAPVQTLSSWLEAGLAPGLKLMPDPRAESGLSALTAQPPPSGVTLFIGPEGGISDGERAVARRHGFQPLRLGPRILRTETAVIAAMAAVMTLWGDLGH
jgi:16S rRNA (uracil1498-N3)-methyltransferase